MEKPTFWEKIKNSLRNINFEMIKLTIGLLFIGFLIFYGLANGFAELTAEKHPEYETIVTIVDAEGNVVKSAQEVVLAAAEKMAAGIAKNAPIAVRNCKKAINEGLDVDMDQAIVIEEKLFGDCFETEDQKYGMAFFLDKNKEKVKEPFKNC